MCCVGVLTACLATNEKWHGGWEEGVRQGSGNGALFSNPNPLFDNAGIFLLGVLHEAFFFSSVVLANLTNSLSHLNSLYAETNGWIEQPHPLKTPDTNGSFSSAMHESSILKLMRSFLRLIKLIRTLSHTERILCSYKTLKCCLSNHLTTRGSLGSYLWFRAPKALFGTSVSVGITGIIL
jgi:hypothetical protein